MRSSGIYVIFDMDGVIFDTERIYLESCEQAAERLGLGDIRGLALSVIGITAQATRQKYIDHFGSAEVCERFWDEARKITYSVFESGIPVKPGAGELLRYLESEGIPAAIASSTVTDVVRSELSDAGLLDYFCAVTGGDQVTKSKPDPEIFLRAAESLGAEPGKCIVIEDSFNGIRAAHSAGMIPLMVPDLLSPDDEIRSLAKLIMPSLYEVRDYIQKLRQEEKA